MSAWRLVAREIWHRKLHALVSVAAAAVAVGFVVGAFLLLLAHDLRTDAIIAEKQAEAQTRIDTLRRDYEKSMADNEEFYRKVGVRMGFNVLILPEDQNLADLYAEDYASKTMPESYVTRLASSRIVTVRHLLPILQRKCTWPERERTVILVGTRGEVPLLRRNPKKPILDAVEPGAMVLGHELHRSLDLKVGDAVTFKGRSFTVSQCYEQRGTKDDITLWINLAEAQQLLGMPDRINGILALECECASADVAQVRDELAAILPGTQVIEKAGQALARAESRRQAAELKRATLQRTEAEAVAAIQSERRLRDRSRQQRQALFAVLVPVVVLASLAGIGFAAYTNVQQRRGEIGILRALGVGSGTVFGIVLLKAALVGLVGALAGVAAGWLVGTQGSGAVAAGLLFDPVLLVGAVAVAPLAAMLASWLPAVWAAGQDPALILSEQ